MSYPSLIVDLPAIVENYRLLQQQAGGARLGAAVKANAYGLGMMPVARALQGAGCDLFFTAYAQEAFTLRSQDTTSEIAALHGFDKADFRDALAHNITPVLNYLGAIEEWAAFARAEGRTLPAMVHMDTGMNRLGLSLKEQEYLATHQELLNGLDIRAWITHFACAEQFDNPMTTRQRDLFLTSIAGLPKAPACLCNSSGLFWGRDYTLDMARPGIALYGGNPTPHLPNPMKNVISLRAPILQIRDVAPGMSVGYGASHYSSRPTKIATLALGYADGYHRALSNKGRIALGEQHTAPLVGRVSMDLVTIDVTGLPPAVAHVGAEVTLIGAHRPIDQAAQEAGTISYEILTSLGERVTRKYVG